MNIEWTLFTKRTNMPKLLWLERELAKAKILHFRDGKSFHAPILRVDKAKLDEAWEILTPVDDVPDDDPRFEEKVTCADPWGPLEDYRCEPEHTSPYLPLWLRIGRSNPWIRSGNDPIFNRKSFTRFVSTGLLAREILKGNWCLGEAFWHKDLCLINQVNGGDEWLVIRQDTAFESFSCQAIAGGYITEDEEHNDQIIGVLRTLFDEILEATVADCKALNYRRAKRPA